MSDLARELTEQMDPAMRGSLDTVGNALATEKYCYSLDEEYFQGECTSREEALELATVEADADGHRTVWTGVIIPADLNRYARGHADCVVDHMADAASDDVGEAAESWPTFDRELIEDLDAAIATAIRGWMKKHDLEPGFFSVKDVVKHEHLPPCGPTK